MSTKVTIPNFDPARIPDPTEQATFHADATYVFDHMGSEVLPKFNQNLDWFEGALTDDLTSLVNSMTAYKAALTTLGHRNKIINGQFNINQRGETSYTASGYTLDRWRLDNGSGAANTIKQGTFALGQTDVPGNPEHYLIWERATAGTALSTVSQRIEGVETLAGQTITRTFWVKATAATELRPVVRQFFGTGGSPSATVSVNSTEESVTTGWTKIKVSLDVPSVSGKTLGTNGDDYLELALERDHTDTNATATVHIANVSFVEGNATSETDPGAWRSETSEMRECRRYYRKSDGRELGVTFNAPSSGDFFYSTESYPEMRIVPSVVLDSSAGAEINLSSISATDISKTSFRYTGQSSSSGRAGWIGGYTANAEI